MRRVDFWKVAGAILVLCSLQKAGVSIECYECSSELEMDEYDACLYGDWRYLPRTLCKEPSVCAVYQYQTAIPGPYRVSISRGCQAVRFGATCEHIFNDLRSTDQVLPGQHTCTTCSDDLCNSTNKNTVKPHVLTLLLILVTFIVKFM